MAGANFAAYRAISAAGPAYVGLFAHLASRASIDQNGALRLQFCHPGSIAIGAKGSKKRGLQ